MTTPVDDADHREGMTSAEIEALMGGIRERAALARARGVAATELGDERADLEVLHRTFDVQRPPLSSHRPLLGSLVLAVKRVLLRLLTPSLEAQTRNNVATMRLLASCDQRLRRLERLVVGTELDKNRDENRDENR